ncbi:oxidoreductase [Mycobacterium eburneum]|nr:oxidoreductase [Mycobacterium eburneum]
MVGTLVIRGWRRLWSSPLLTLNGWMAFNLPRTVTAVGATLLLAIVALHGYLLATQPALPAYFVVYAAVLAAGCLVAAAATAWGRSGGWYLGSLVCLVFLGIYLISRFVALPALGALTGRWDVAAGTFAMAFAAAFIGLHATVLSGINVAYPQRQNWRD